MSTERQQHPQSTPASGVPSGQDAQHKANKTLKLITKLLAKAENTPYPAEALAFQEHAERLMVRYGIEQAEIDAEAGRQGRPQERMVEERLEFTGQYRVGQVLGFSQIAIAFDSVRVLQATTPSKKLLYIIGAESDVSQIVRLFTSLHLQMDTAMTAWWVGYPLKGFLTAHEKTLERRQFQLAFLTTVSERIAAWQESESRERGPGSELVLMGRRDRAEQYASELYPDVRRSRRHSLSPGSYGAHAAGSRAGTLARVNSEVRSSQRRAVAP